MVSQFKNVLLDFFIILDVLEKDFGMAEFYYLKAKNKNSV